MKIVNIYVDGLDSAGKDTIKAALKKHYNNRIIVAGRGPLGYMAYNILFKKGFSNDDYVRCAQSMNQNTLIFWIVVGEETSYKRSAGRGEKPEDLFKNGTTYKQNYNAFDASKNILELNGIKVYKISNEGPLENTVNDIVKTIEEYENMKI